MNTPTPPHPTPTTITKIFIIVIIFVKWKKMVALWNSRTIKQFSQIAQYLSDVTESPTVKSAPCGCFVDTVRLPCAFAPVFMVQSHFQYWYRKSTSALKRSIWMSSISFHIKLVNIAFQSVPCIHAEWAILGDDVHDASRRLLYFYWNTVTGPKYSNDRASKCGNEL